MHCKLSPSIKGLACSVWQGFAYIVFTCSDIMKPPQFNLEKQQSFVVKLEATDLNEGDFHIIILYFLTIKIKRPVQGFLSIT